MNTKSIKINWLIPLLGLAVVGGGLVAGTTYLKLERKSQAEEAFTATLDRLFLDHQISVALKTLHNGEVAVAAQRLDRLVCGHIVRTDSELASADAQTRTYVKDAFVRLALLRPKNAQTSGEVPGERYNDQLEAERILGQACATIPGAQEGATAAR